MPNSHTLKVGVFDLPMVEYVGMRCIYCGYGKGTAGDSNNWISYNTKFPKKKSKGKSVVNILDIQPTYKVFPFTTPRWCGIP